MNVFSFTKSKSLPSLGMWQDMNIFGLTMPKLLISKGRLSMTHTTTTSTRGRPQPYAEYFRNHRKLLAPLSFTGTIDL